MQDLISQQSKTPLQLSTQDLTQRKLNLMRESKAVAIKILTAFPDYGKAPPEYITSMVEVVASYPQSFHAAFADLKTGIASRTKGFLPTPFDFSEMAKELQKELERQHRLADMDERFKATALRAPDGPYEPQGPVRYYDKRGNDITPRQAEESRLQHEREVASMKKVERHTAYVKELGSGDYMAGMLVMIERNIIEPPNDWNPK